MVKSGVSVSSPSTAWSKAVPCAVCTQICTRTDSSRRCVDSGISTSCRSFVSCFFAGRRGQILACRWAGGLAALGTTPFKDQHGAMTGGCSGGEGGFIVVVNGKVSWKTVRWMHSWVLPGACGLIIANPGRLKPQPTAPQGSVNVSATSSTALSSWHFQHRWC